MDRFFSYCPECRFETHATAEEAEKAADEHLDHFRDEAPEGWSEDVTGICWGEIKGTIQETLRRPYDPEQDVMIDSSCDEVVDYGVLPIPEPISQA